MDLLTLRGAFPFDPSLGFFVQEQCTPSVNEKSSWALSWTPADLPSSSYEYDTPSSSSVSTFFTPSKPIDILAPPISKQRGERKSRRGGFFGTIYGFLFRGEATLHSVRAHWSSPPPHFPPTLKRSRRTMWPKWSRTGIRAVFQRRWCVAEGLVAV